MPILNNYTIYKKSIFFCFLVFIIVFIVLPVPVTFAHLENSSSGGQIIGKYSVVFGLEPKYTMPQEQSKIIFSIQDLEGNDIENIQTSIEIYENSLKKQILVDPWKQRESGDFEMNYTFEKIGAYQIVLNISENKVLESTTQQTVVSGTESCDCTRVVFNVSVSNYWFYLWNGAMIFSIVMVCTVFGIAVAMNYSKRKKDKKTPIPKQEVLKYTVMFLAVAGGLIHMSIYIDHAQLQIEYALFLLLTSISQVGFGMLLLTVLISKSESKNLKSDKTNDKKNTMVYLFGLIGSVILVGLYTYVVTFTLPLSTDIQPENIAIPGIIAVSLEISLIVIISYLLYWEHAQKKRDNITN